MKQICITICTALLMAAFGACAAAQESFSLRGYDQGKGYQYVQLGEFPQDADGTVRPILWRVLSVDETQAYLLSEYILFCNRIHPDDNAYVAFKAAFNQTEMFDLLNGPFEGDPLPEAEREKLKKRERLGYAHIAQICFKDQAFTPVEQSMLFSDEELGMVFLASAEDLQNRKLGFTSAQSRKAFGTEYALQNGLFQYQNDSSPYWTRSQSKSFAYGTRCTKFSGNLGYIRCVVMNEGCRPAIRLLLEDLTPIGGNGTKENPYRFSR